MAAIPTAFGEHKLAVAGQYLERFEPFDYLGHERNVGAFTVLVRAAGRCQTGPDLMPPSRSISSQRAPRNKRPWTSLDILHLFARVERKYLLFM